MEHRKFHSLLVIIGLLVAVIALVLAWSAYNKSNDEDQMSDVTSSEACEQAGGVWEQFPDACADTCDYAANPDLMCAQVLTESCDCGQDRCWNGVTCEPI